MRLIKPHLNINMASQAQSQKANFIAYVQNLSPIKRNKKNTIDYSTLTLQTDECTTQPALCYSKAKTKILEEKESTRSAIKIMKYTYSEDQTKIVINDKTIITAPDDLEYSFQYHECDLTKPVPLADVSKDDVGFQDPITVCAKVSQIFPAKTVVNQQGRSNKVSEVTIFDKTASMRVDLWNEQIAQVEANCVYRFTKLSTTYWNNVKKLTGTVNTLIKEIFGDPELSTLKCPEETAAMNEFVIKASSIHTIEDVQQYKVCCNCKRKIVQVQELVVKCEYCSHMMRTSKCPVKMFAKLVIMDDDKKKSLTVFEEVLKDVLGEFDEKTIDTGIIVQKLLFLENITCSYNDRNIITQLKTEL